jgi:endonuclease/exonuclease/phosphatase (EEP) superfamily protein YafD
MRAIIQLTLSSCLLVGCFTQPIAPDREQAEISPETSACLERLSGTAFSSAHRLDNSGFSIVNWNVQKGKHENWAGDLQDLHLGADLLILQEAPGEFDEWDEIAPLHHRSFAEGFGLSRSVTGVLTMSSVEPLTECKLVALEPWFLTRKATLVTEYALTDTVETLLVVNIHSINFSFGVKHMRKQLSQAAAVIEHHDGPVLLSGDFNTWRGRRAEVVETLVKHLGLVALEYDVDHRKRWFGRALDHIYVRGLRALQATTMEVGSSDHNPMAVRFSYWPEHRGITAAP